MYRGYGSCRCVLGTTTGRPGMVLCTKRLGAIKLMNQQVWIQVLIAGIHPVFVGMFAGVALSVVLP